MDELIVQGELSSKILILRGQNGMLDRDLAKLYQVENRVLNQSVKRNIDRFPDDFMFQITKEEFENWKSQIVISSSVHGGIRKMPYVFAEEGPSTSSGTVFHQCAGTVFRQCSGTDMEI